MVEMLSGREELILRTIINEYILNSEPIGSRNVSKIGPLKMSPATIRNIMGDLEEKGFLTQPHTSAGRVPSDLGYRYYIDHIVSTEEVNPALFDNVRDALNFSPANLSSLMQEFTKRLSALTNSVGFIVTSKLNTNKVKQIEFTRLSKHTVLGIIVTEVGFVQNVLLNMDESIKDSDLVSISNYLNNELKTTNILDLQNKLKADISKHTGGVRDIAKKFDVIEKDFFHSDLFRQDFVFGGTSNILNLPEFKDTEKLKALIDTLDEKETIVNVLGRCMESDGVQIFVGSEIGIDKVNELGLITKSYKQGGNVIGMLGVIAPKRMRYPTVIPMVDYSAKIMNKILSELYGGKDER